MPTAARPQANTLLAPVRGRRGAGAVTAALSTVVAVALALSCGWLAAAANAVPALSWSAPQEFDHSGQPPRSLACPSESLCVVVDGAGDIFRTADPLGGAPVLAASTGVALNAVSCASVSLCVAVGGHDAFTSRDGGLSWSAAAVEAEGNTLSGVACPAESLCVAVDESGRVLATANPNASGWAAQKIDGTALRAVSCFSASDCVVVDGAGAAFGSEAPGAGSWSGRTIDASALTAVSCALLNALCVATDAGGAALASANGGSAGATWSSTPIDSGGHLQAVSCAASGLCVAVDEHGLALASDDATAALPVWSPSGADGVALTAVSCLPGGVCPAVDTAGRFLLGRVPAPEVFTMPPALATESSATLSGSVDPHDAALGTCLFEYGPTEAYGQSVPCASFPSAVGGAQLVAAAVGGLQPNTSYHYRLVAASLTGTAIGADQRFATAVNSQVAIVVPHPSIHGTPAVGSHLSCQPGTSGTAQLTYSWLRDLIPIARASSSTYTVAGADSGHHLQCQVSASDAGGTATARSAFVTVPVEGVVAAAGETVVGGARYRSGALKVAILCSSQAFSGCRLAIRLSTVGRGAVTLAFARLHLSRGQHRTVSLALDATGRRLLQARRRLSAQLTVSGTVIGILEALLSRQRVRLG